MRGSLAAVTGTVDGGHTGSNEAVGHGRHFSCWRGTLLSTAGVQRWLGSVQLTLPDRFYVELATAQPRCNRAMSNLQHKLEYKSERD